MRCASRLRQFGFGLLLAPWIFGCVSADDEPTRSAIFSQHTKLAKRASKELSGLFKEARKKGLEGVADEIAVQVLHFDENDESARAWLGYERDGEEWTKPEKLSEHTNSKSKGEATFRKRRAKKMESLGRSFWRMLDKAAEDLDVEARNFAYDDIAALLPADERVTRERTVECKEGYWLTLEARKASEVWRGWQRWKAIRCKDPLKGEDIPLHPRLDDTSTLTWRARVKVGGVKIWGTCSRKDAVDIGTYATCAAALFAKVFALDYRLPEDLGFIVVESEQERMLLANGMHLSGMRRVWPGFDLRDTNVFVTARWQGWPVRMDTALRFMLCRLYEEAFGYQAKCEWASQGVSSLISYMTKPTYYTVMGWDDTGATAIDAVLQKLLFKRDAAWGIPARDLKNEGLLPTVVQLEPQSRRQIWITDLLACNQYAYYIVAVHNDKAASFFRRLGKGETATEAIQAEFGWSMAEFEARVGRWMNDYRKYEEGKSRRTPVRGDRPR